MDLDNAPIMQKLCHLFQDITMMSENAIYYKPNVQCWVKCMKVVNPLFEELQETSGPLNDDEVSHLHTLEAVCVKMKELLEKCAGKTSKSLPVLLKQRILKAFAELSMDLQSGLRLFPLRTQLSDHIQEQVVLCSNQLETHNFHMDSLEERLHEEIANALMEIKKGVKLSHRMLVDIAEKLDLTCNQEILREACLLEKERNKAHLSKEKVDEEFINLLIILMTQMADDLAEQKQLLEHEHKISIPTDFRCPLSLELMKDPVIVASGQTYERVNIQQWFDQGNTSCPKSRKQLAHMNLIPNYNVKFLIANWSESNGMSVPVAEKPTNGTVNHIMSKEPSPDALRPPGGNSAESQMTLDDDSHTGEDGSFSVIEAMGNSSIQACNGSSIEDSIGALSLQNEFSGDRYLASSSVAACNEERGSSCSGSSKRSTQNNCSTVQRIGPVEPNLSGDNEDIFQLQVQALLKDLQSPLADAQSIAVKELRLLTRHNTQNRIIIAKCGAIRPLVSLLHSADPEIQENAVTALLNLSINDNNKSEISTANPIDSLAHVLSVGTPAAKENAAATLFSLSLMDNENKAAIGQSAAIPLLIDLLINGSPRGKKDAVQALYNLSTEPRNKLKLVRSNAVKPLVALMSDPAAGLVDKAVAVIHNLAHIPEGVASIGEVHGGISGLVEVVETGSQRGKENATAALLLLCSHNIKFRISVLQEGAIPPLAALARSGTNRAKEKAKNLLRLLRDQRQTKQGADMHRDHHRH